MKRGKLVMVLVAVMAISLSCSKDEPNQRSAPRYKTIYLVRHATAPHVSSTLVPDFERLLDSTGQAEANRMGNYLDTKIHDPNLILISPAQRTVQTTQLLCIAMGYDWLQVQQDTALYLCTPEVLLNTLRHLPDEHSTVMVVGHNPATTQVANILQNNQVIPEVPPMGVVAIQFEVTSWIDVDIKNSHLFFFATPGNIE